MIIYELIIYVYQTKRLFLKQKLYVWSSSKGIDWLTDSYNFGCLLWEFIFIYFATRIRIHVSWSGSISGQMIRIRNTDENNYKLHTYKLLSS